MTRWVFPVAIVALLSNLVALLLTLLGDRPASVVLGLAVVADLAIVIALASRSRVAFSNTAQASREIPPSIDTSMRQAGSPNRVAELLPVSADEAANQQLTLPESEQPASTNPIAPEPEPETGDSDTEAGWAERGVRSEAKEDLLENFRWLGLVEECVELEEELADLLEHLDGSSQRVVDHTILRLQEILERSSVEVIADESTFDRARHKAESVQPIPAPGTTITATLRPGFAVGPRVLRRAQVQISNSSPPDEDNSSTGGQQ